MEVLRRKGLTSGNWLNIVEGSALTNILKVFAPTSPAFFFFDCVCVGGGECERSKHRLFSNISGTIGYKKKN